MSDASPTHAISKNEVYDLLSSLYPSVATHRLRPLSDYARTAFASAPWQTTSAIRRNAMEHLCQAIARAAKTQGASTVEAEALSRTIYAMPVLQTGPHLHLLLEPDAFYTHVFSLLGLRGNHQTAYISYACSTVKFVERGRKGPGWLTIDGLGINVFGLSRSKMIPYSILARNRSYRFELSNADHSPSIESRIEALRESLPIHAFPSAAEAIKVANRCLWKERFPGDVGFLQFDDEDVADLVADHLDDGASWLAANLFHNPVLAQSIIGHIDRLQQTAWRDWLRNATHFFWGNDGGRLFPLRLEGMDFYAVDGKERWVPVSAVALSDALRQRRIIPNLFLMFLVTAMMPGLRVLGGSRHAIYYPLMRYVLCSALFEFEEGFEFLAAMCWDERPTIWGHRVLSEDAEPAARIETLNASSIQKICDRYGAIETFEACGTLSSFCEDPLWKKFHAAFEAGLVGPRSAQWCFA